VAVFDKAKLGIPCPKCGHETKKTIAWIKSHVEMTCSGCGSAVTLDSSKLEKGLGRVEKQIDGLKRKLSRLGERY